MAEKKQDTAEKETNGKKGVSKGESLSCEVYGLSVVVEEVDGVAVGEASAFLCCGKPMKKKASKATAKK